MSEILNGLNEQQIKAVAYDQGPLLVLAGPGAGTFHAFSHDLIRAYGDYIGIPPDFIIYDKPEDSIKLLIDGVRKRVDEELRGDVEPTILSEKYRDMTIIEETMPDFYYTIIKLKNRLIFHDALSPAGGGN
jgi:superfamily I DNA/RNA helicase